MCTYDIMSWEYQISKEEPQNWIADDLSEIYIHDEPLKSLSKMGGNISTPII